MRAPKVQPRRLVTVLAGGALLLPALWAAPRLAPAQAPAPRVAAAPPQAPELPPDIRRRVRALGDRQRRSPLIRRALEAAAQAEAAQPEAAPGEMRLAPGPGAHVGAALSPTSLDPKIRSGIGRITGLLPPANLLEQARHINAESKELQVRLGAAPPPPSTPLPSRFSWRATTPSIVTPSRDQGNWNTCWAFATIGAFESAYARVNVAGGTSVPRFSEQAVINCSGAGTAQNGGWWAFAYLRDFGATPYANLPYTGQGPPQPPSSCSQTTNFRALNYNYVDPSNAYYPERSLIKRAILEHGPVAAGVFATDGFMSHLDGTVFRERFGPGGQGYDRSVGANHAIVIVGWNDTQGGWIIKNSYGPDNWGVSGFGYIAYETNNIGFGAAWVDAVTTSQRATQVGTLRSLFPSAGPANGGSPGEPDPPATPDAGAAPPPAHLDGEAEGPGAGAGAGVPPPPQPGAAEPTLKPPATPLGEVQGGPVPR